MHTYQSTNPTLNCRIYNMRRECHARNMKNCINISKCFFEKFFISNLANTFLYRQITAVDFRYIRCLANNCFYAIRKFIQQLISVFEKYLYSTPDFFPVNPVTANILLIYLLSPSPVARLLSSSFHRYRPRQPLTFED